MFQGRIFVYLQAVIALVYITLGVVFLLKQNMSEYFSDTMRIAFGILLLIFGGFRAVTAYRKFRVEKGNDQP